MALTCMYFVIPLNTAFFYASAEKMQAQFLISDGKWIILQSRIKHRIEAVIHVLSHLVLENKWQKNSFFQSVPYLW